MDSIVAPTTLQEHLLSQLHTSDTKAALAPQVEFLIGNLDDRGFLNTRIDELSLTHGIPIDVLNSAKKMLQSFDPVGVGSEDLRECLLVQLDRLGKKQSLAWRLVDQYIDDLANKRYPILARKLGVPLEQISRAADFISTLDPRPAQRFAVSSNNYVTPDVVVERQGGEWIAVMTNDDLPHLRISNTYKDLMAQGENSAEVRNYIREKIRAGKFLIKSLHQRQQTILNIANEIVHRQREFMSKGVPALKPLTMVQVAQVVGVHETTVSRAVSGKYIQTPQGMFEMKYFFTAGIQTASSEGVPTSSMSNTSVKNMIAEIFKAEDTARPLSDQEVVRMLKEKGIVIARRTVAKYRSELNILPSNLRKVY